MMDETPENRKNQRNTEVTVSPADAVGDERAAGSTVVADDEKTLSSTAADDEKTVDRTAAASDEKSVGDSDAADDTKTDGNADTVDERADVTGTEASKTADASEAGGDSVWPQRVIDENRPVRDRSEQKNLRTMKVSEILHDEDWDTDDDTALADHHVRREWRPREHRLWVRLLTKFLILAAIIGSFCFVFLYGFRLRQVIITGNYTYTDEEILNFLHYNEYPKNTLYFGWKNKEDITEGIPFIERISVRISGPSSILVTVQERMIIGCIEDSGVYMFFDNTGAVVESSTSKPEDVPLVTGLNLSDLYIGDQLNLNDRSVFNNLYELSIYLRNYDVTVEQIDYNEDQSMVMHKGDISILLGVGTNLEDKINAFKDLEPYLEGLSGTLHLEDYDSSKDHINFSKE